MVTYVPICRVHTSSQVRPLSNYSLYLYFVLFCSSSLGDRKISKGPLLFMCLFDEIRSSTRLDFQLGKEPALVTEARLDMREPQKSSLGLEFNALENLKKGQDKIVHFFQIKVRNRSTSAPGESSTASHVYGGARPWSLWQSSQSSSDTTFWC